jgi:DNA repair exonuclease SbcCD ATPase subunit
VDKGAGDCRYGRGSGRADIEGGDEMKLVSITLQGFKSFTDEQRVLLPMRGFYLMTGRNDVEKQLEGNAVGKSTLWDALCWALYGKTARGTRAGTIINWESDFSPKTAVTVEFLHRGTRFYIKRTQEPNGIYLKTDESPFSVIPQEDIDKMLHLTYQEFLSAILLGQFNQYFVDLSPTEKMIVFSDLCDLKVWTVCSNIVKDKLKAAELALDDLQRKEITLAERLKMQEASIIELKASVERFEDELDEQIKEKKDDIARIEKVAATNKIDASQLTEIQEEIKQAEKALELEKKARAAAREKKGELVGEMRPLSEALDALNQTLKSGKKICPSCKQAVTETHLKNEIKKTNHEQSLLLEKNSELTDVAGKAENEIARLTREIEDLRRKERAIQQEQTTNKARIDTIEAMKDALREIKARKNPYILSLETTEKTHVKTDVEYGDIVKELKNKQTEKSRVEFWEKGFKELRLWIVDRILRQFEIHVNNNLDALGLHGWGVRFEMEKENKSGTYSRGFNVFITPDGQKDEIPWEAFSGGETQRLRLAGAAGLSDMIRARYGDRVLTLEVWDEPSAHISQQGIDDMMSWLRDRREDRTVWVIEHRLQDFGGFDGKYQITKKATGSVFSEIS